MNIETVITITHFSVSVKQLIGFLRACIWLPADLLLDSRHLFSTLATQLLEYLTSRGLGFGQPVPLHHACCPTSRVFGFPRAYFWAIGTSSPRLLPIFSSIWLPASLVLDSRYLFSALAAHLLEYLASRGLTFGQPTPLLRACCPFSHLISFPRTYFWTAGTSSPRLLPKYPPGRPLQNRFGHIQDSKPRRSTNKSTSPPTKKSPYGLFFANSFYIRRS